MRWLIPLLVFAAGLVLGGWAALNAVPGAIMNKAMTRIAANTGNDGRAHHAPRLREDNQTIVRASPDILYSVCIFDVSERPLAIEAPWPSDGHYASVSFYDARTNNFAVMSDRDAGGAASSRILLQSDGEAGSNAAYDRTILAPTTTGLVLYRRVIDAETDMDTVQAERRGFTCTELSDQ